MKKENDDKKKQLRRTHYDTQICQKKLRNIVKEKIKKNEKLTEEECKKWNELTANSFLSVGMDKTVYLDTPTLKICFGSVHTFALRFLDWGNPVVFTYQERKCTFEIKCLWKLLYEHCLELFPLALADAIRMSRESEEREKWDSYGFSSKSELEDEKY